MAQRRWNKAELARQLGCSRTAVTDMLTDGTTSTLVPDVEELLGMPTSLINIGSDSGKHQFVGATKENVERPLGWDTPAPPSEYEPEAPLPSPVAMRIVATGMNSAKRITDYFVASSDASLLVLELFNELNTRNRGKAIQSLRELVKEQNDMEQEIAQRVEQQRAAERLADLNDTVSIYLSHIEKETGEQPKYTDDLLELLQRLVATDTTADLERFIGSMERKPPKGTDAYALLLEVWKRHKAHLEREEKAARTDAETKKRK